ncbi:hypothetical protein BH24PSE2_BH24PSE2_03460 [soil metagenome]
MNRSMQERLVGTIVVVVLAIVLIPTLLDGPDSAGPPARVAEPSKASKSRTIHLDDEERLPVAEPTSRAPAEPVEQPVAEITPAVPASGQPEPAASKVPEQPAAPADAPAQERGETLPHSAADDSARTSGGTSSRQAAESGWAVQVGSFTSAANAQRLAGSLREKGFATFISPHEQGGRTLLRVRVGPEPARTQAEALAGRLAKLGYKTQVVQQP